MKMIHNGIEYGLMQAYAEGFDILRNANTNDLPEDHRYDFKVADIAEVWRRGSVVGSWILDLTAMALFENPTLSNYSGYVQDSGEGRWTIMAAIEEAVPVDVLQRHYSRVSAHARGTRMLKSCYRLCDKNLVAILNGSRKGSIGTVVIVHRRKKI